MTFIRDPLMNYEKLRYSKISILSLFLLIFLMTGIASASITLTDQDSTISLSDTVISVPDLYDYIVKAKGMGVAHAQYIEKVEPGVWHIKGFVKSSNNGKLVFHSEHGNELRISRTFSPGGTSFLASVDFRDVTIRQWNAATDQPIAAIDSMRWHFLSNSYFEGVTFHTFNRIYFGDTAVGGAVTNVTLKDVYMTDWYRDVRLRGTYFTLYNVSMVDSHDLWHTERAGFRSCITSNSTYENIYVNPFKTFPKGASDSTGSYGIQASGTFDVYRNIHIENTTYSGFVTGGNYNQYYNVTIHNSDHNQIEIRENNAIWDGVRVTGGVPGAPGTQSGILVARATSSSPRGENVTVKNVYMYNYGQGGWLKTDGDLEPLVNYRFENITSMYGPTYLFGLQDSVFKNVTLYQANSRGDAGWQYSRSTTGNHPTKNVTLIDVSIDSGKHYMYFSSADIILANLKHRTFGSGHTGTSYYVYYPLDVKVTNTEGSPVQNALVTISSDVCVIDSKGTQKNTASTDIRGRLSADDVFYVADFRRVMSSAYTYYTHTLSASKDGKYNVSFEVDPESTWYCENPNIPTYTITAIIPDDNTSDPSIIGFAPSEDNPFVLGSTKKFRVWTDEALTSMKWYVDGSQVSSGSLEYNWNIQEGSHTIHFEGANANGAVMQSWSISEEPEIPEEQKESNIPVPESSGSGTSYTPSATSFTASVGSSTNFIVNTDEQFTSTQWYFNSEPVASGTTYTQNWAASGSFTVRFEGADDLGTTTRTWNVIVTGSEYSAISVVPSASVVSPGETFSLDMYIDPKQPVTGAQLNLHYSTLASVTSVKDGGLFKTGGLSNTFQSGTIDNSAGVLRNVYSAIMGPGTVSTPGSMATVTMVAGASSGMLELTLSNVVLSDAYSNPAPYDITYASILVDTAPLFNAIPAMSVEEESALTFAVSATDADGDALTYSSTSLPQGATFNAASRTFSWTPARGQTGTYSIEFSVTDGYLNDTATAAITVTSLDLAPVITLFEPASGSEFEEGQVIDISVVAEDPEGESLSYSLTINGIQASSSASYRWVTDYSCAGTHSIGVTVSDGNSQVSQTHTVTILDVHPRWDVNMDGIVNILDITLVGQNYGNVYSEDLPRWDVNQDGIVNVQDLSIVAAHFGETVQ
jgi:hypothetical protein